MSDVPVEVVELSGKISLDAGEALGCDFTLNALNVRRGPIYKIDPMTPIVTGCVREYLLVHDDRILKLTSSNPLTRPDELLLFPE